MILDKSEKAKKLREQRKFGKKVGPCFQFIPRLVLALVDSPFLHVGYSCHSMCEISLINVSEVANVQMPN